MDAAVFKTLERIYNEKDETARLRLKEESNAALAEHFSHPAHIADLQELAFDLLNLAWADAMREDITGRIIEVNTVGLGEPDFFDEDLRGMRAYWQGKGGQIRSDILRYERMQMPREEMVWAIDQHVDELATNFWGPIEKLREHANEKLRQLPVTRLVELIRAAIASGVYYGSFAASTLTADQVRSVVEQVAARSGGQATILGTDIALRHLSRIGLEYGDEFKAQIMRTGMIGVFEGWPVAQVENFEDFAGNLVLPTNELFIVGRRAGKLTYYGGPKGQVLQLTAFRRRWETARDAGMLLVGADPAHGRIGRIVFT